MRFIPRSLCTRSVLDVRLFSFWCRHIDEQLIVTPFAQILHRLQTVRNSYSQLTNISK